MTISHSPAISVYPQTFCYFIIFHSAALDNEAHHAFLPIASNSSRDTSFPSPLPFPLSFPHKREVFLKCGSGCCHHLTFHSLVFFSPHLEWSLNFKVSSLRDYFLSLHWPEVTFLYHRHWFPRGTVPLLFPLHSHATWLIFIPMQLSLLATFSSGSDRSKCLLFPLSIFLLR